MRAVLNDVVVAESDDTVVVEGNHYLPPDAVNWELLADSSHTSVCPWKGSARYWSVQAGGGRAEDAAWSSPTPSRPLPRSPGSWRSGVGCESWHS